MIQIAQAILVEGRYDVNAVRQVVDTVVLQSGGFRIFNDREKLQMLRRIAQVKGLILLTDSDGAGFVIRNYLKGALPKGRIGHAYIPEIVGKERRKRQASKEGILGVEGMRPEVILQALRQAGATFLEEQPCEICRSEPLNKADFYALGLSGREDSAARRAALLRQLALPTHMSANALLEYINAVSSRMEIEDLISRIS